MKLIESILGAFLVVGLGYVFFSFTPFLFNIVFWPQYLAERHGMTSWQTWPVALEFLIPVAGWTLIFLLLARFYKWTNEAH
jgi:hypothetical protein